MSEPISFPPAADHAVDADVRALGRVRAKDAEALLELYDRHGRTLYGLMLQISGEGAIAERLLEELFADVWRGAAVFDRALGTPRSWLIGLARYRALDHGRAHGASSGSHRAGRGLFIGAPPLADEADGRVAAALESLPPDQRTLIEYVFFCGMSLPELAAQLQLKVDDVKSGLRLGMMALRERLNQMNRSGDPF